MKRTHILLFALMAALPQARAGDYYVDNVAGRDEFDGRSPEADAPPRGPFRTLAHATRALKPGDTLHLAATGVVYREILTLPAGGRPGRPIAIDGHGAWLTGADPLPADGWRPAPNTAAGTRMRGDVEPTGHRFGLVVNGKLVLQTRDFDRLEPGEFAVGGNPKLPTIYHRPLDRNALAGRRIVVIHPDGERTTLAPDRWRPSHSRLDDVLRHRGMEKPPAGIEADGRAIEPVRAHRRLGPGQWTRVDGLLYYRPPADTAIEEMRLMAVVRDNGVYLGGGLAHVTIRNLNVVYAANDGFNIHGRVTDASFVNCNAFHCFDEGFSAHDHCRTTLDGGVFIDCDNGIANVNRGGESTTRNVIVSGARNVGLLIQQRGDARHRVSDSIILDSPRQLVFLTGGERTKGACTIENLLVAATPDAATAPRTALTLGRNVTLKRITAAGADRVLFADGRASAHIVRSLLAGGRGGVHFRAKDPSEIVVFRNVRVEPDLEMTWGMRPPWTRTPVATWFADRPEAAPGCGAMAIDLENALFAGRVPANYPEAIGCRRESIMRFLKFTKERDALLRRAEAMGMGRAGRSRVDR